VSSEIRSEKPSKKYKNILITIPRFELFEFRQLKAQLLRRHGAVIFWPFFDNGEIYGYAIPYVKRNEKFNEKLIVLDERFIRDVALLNASWGGKMWIEIQNWGITTTKI